MSTVRGKIDFGILHIYPTPIWGRALSSMAVKDIFEISFSQVEYRFEKYLKDTSEVLKEYSGRNVPLAITEYNCGFVQEKPVPYRHTLGCALVNADLIRMFMAPGSNVGIANLWNYANTYTGMISNDFDGSYRNLSRPYYKRPNYYVYKLYHDYFGAILLENVVECDSFYVNNKNNLFLSVNSSLSEDGNKIYLMVINKNMDRPITSDIHLENFSPAAKGSAWVLNGPSIDATNEENHDNVKVTHKKFKIASSSATFGGETPRNDTTFEFTFEPHSLTAIEVLRAQ